MPSLVANDVPLKIDVDGGLKERLEEAFQDQGVTMRVGLTRLIEFFLEQPSDVWPFLLKQVRGGDAIDEIARRRFSQMIAAGKIDSPVTAAEATRIIRLMTDHLDTFVRSYEEQLSRSLPKVKPQK